MKTEILGVMAITAICLVLGCCGVVERAAEDKRAPMDAEAAILENGMRVEITNMNDYEWTGCVLDINGKYRLGGYEDPEVLNFTPGGSKMFTITHFISETHKPAAIYEGKIRSYRLECDEGVVTGAV